MNNLTAETRIKSTYLRENNLQMLAVVEYALNERSGLREKYKQRPRERREFWPDFFLLKK